RPSWDVPCGVYHGPWRRERATARARGRGARLPRQADQPARGAREDPPVGGGGQMTGRHFLAVVAVAQGALLVALIILIILNRWFRLRRRARVHPRVVRLNAAMQRWALGSTDLGSVLVHLGRLPIPLAVDALVSWSARVPGDRWRQLAPTVGAYYAGRLRQSRPVVVQLLLKMLQRSDDPALPRLAEFAGRLNEPALREALTALGAHPDPEVRVQAARGVGAFPHPASI